MTPFVNWLVASPSELFDWQEKYLDIYPFYLNEQMSTEPGEMSRHEPHRVRVESVTR